MDSLLTPENVTRLWNKPAPAADKSYALKERSERLTDIDARVRDGSYPDSGVPLAAAVAAPKFAEDLRLIDVGTKPDLAEAERAEFDRLNDGDRWDGLS